MNVGESVQHNPPPPPQYNRLDKDEYMNYTRQKIEMCSNDASGIFVNHISDHQAIFTITSTKLNNRMEQR